MKRRFLPGIFYAALVLMLSAIVMFTGSCGGCGTKPNPAATDTAKKQVVDATGNDAINDTETVTIGRIWKSPDGKTIKVICNETQNILTLDPNDPSVKAELGQIEDSFNAHAPIKIVSHFKTGVIKKIGTFSPNEEVEFVKEHLKNTLEQAPLAREVELGDVPASKLNIPDKIKIPRPGLTKLLPDLAAAKEVFDFCAKQSCTSPNTVSILPCIPFQYCENGCYARAHKMCWIIETNYKYFCEKVFSYGMYKDTFQYDTATYGGTLRADASKWGGCCVGWWFHVAPVVYVRGTSPTDVKKYVLDPSMFNEPVLLSDWLHATENKNCNPTAHVTHYAIAPSIAYCPWYPDTGRLVRRYTTDPENKKTDKTLQEYQKFPSCGTVQNQ